MKAITPPVVVVAAVLALAMLVFAIWLPIGLFLLLPSAVAILLVIIRNPTPLRAAFLGAAWTAGVYLVAGVAVTLIQFLMGDLANDEPGCDAFCWNNEEGLVVGVVLTAFFAVPMGVLGAIVAALLALVTHSGRLEVSGDEKA